MSNNSYIHRRTFTNLTSTHSLNCVDSCDIGHTHLRKCTKSQNSTFLSPPRQFHRFAPKFAHSISGLSLTNKVILIQSKQSCVHKPLVQQLGHALYFAAHRSPVVPVCRDTEVLRLRKCSAKRKGGLMAM